MSQVDKLRMEFSIDQFVLVGDRGMITQRQAMEKVQTKRLADRTPVHSFHTLLADLAYALVDPRVRYE